MPHFQHINFYSIVTCLIADIFLYFSTMGILERHMLEWLTRQLLVGLLMLALTVPAGAFHVCACTQRSEAAVRRETTVSSQALKPCCAKRLAEKSSRRSDEPRLKSRCCCDELRWNQALAKVVSPRSAQTETDQPSFVPLGNDSLFLVLAHPEREGVTAVLRAGPPLSACIQYCRWQI